MSACNLSDLIAKKPTIIAIDGPVASGKTSLGKTLATKLGINYLDSGIIYRLITHYYQKNINTLGNQSTKNKKAWLKQLVQTIRWENNTLYCQNIASNAINLHTAKTDADSLAIITQNWIRQVVNQLCRKIIAKKSFVVIGRDANIMICPFADYKFFLTANLITRARRKMLFWQQDNKTINSKINETNLLKSIQTQIYERDQNDWKLQIQQIKKISNTFFKQKEEKDTMARWEQLQLERGAIKIDNSNLTSEATVKKTIDMIANNWKYYPEVAIIGETNVGKSTLFNALVGEKEVLVSKIAGTTRDNYQKELQIGQKHFYLLDTGGIQDEKNIINRAIITKVQNLIDKVNCLLWVVNPANVLTRIQTQIAKWIKFRKKDTILVINKIPDQKIVNTSLFDRWGVEKKITISAKKKINISKLKVLIEANIPLATVWKPAKKEKTILFLGKTNVGKSSLFNALINKKEAITSQEAHTTTNIVKGSCFYQGHHLTFIDTGGIRRKKSKRSLLEAKALAQNKNWMTDVDIIIFIYALNEELTSQDKRNFKLIIENAKPTLIIANKTDLIQLKQKEKIEQLHRFIPKVQKKKVPIIFTNKKTIVWQKQEILQKILITINKKNNII